MTPAPRVTNVVDIGVVSLLTRQILVGAAETLDKSPSIQRPASSSIVGCSVPSRRSIRRRNLPAGERSSRSHRASVLGSTPSRTAIAVWESPCPARCRFRRCPNVSASGRGSYPRNWMTNARQRRSGRVLPLAQLVKLTASTPICFATDFQVSPRVSLRLCKWSPKCFNSLG
jgi:hypothetical protein